MFIDLFNYGAPIVLTFETLGLCSADYAKRSDADIEKSPLVSCFEADTKGKSKPKKRAFVKTVLLNG